MGPIRLDRWFRPPAAVCLAGVLLVACDALGVSPTQPERPQFTRYRVSGIVRDADSARPVTSATIMLRHNTGILTTQADGNGFYAFSFETTAPYRHYIGIGNGTPVEGLGLLLARDGATWGVAGEYRTSVQVLPLGGSEITHDIRLRPVLTLVAGQTTELSVEPDSSHPWELDWDPWTFVYFDRLAEEFLVSAPTDGVLTIAVLPEPGGIIPTMTCGYFGCPASTVQGALSIPIRADRPPYRFGIEIPRGSAPQRYIIETSLR